MIHTSYAFKSNVIYIKKEIGTYKKIIYTFFMSISQSLLVLYDTSRTNNT